MRAALQAAKKHWLLLSSGVGGTAVGVAVSNTSEEAWTVGGFPPTCDVAQLSADGNHLLSYKIREAAHIFSVQEYTGAAKHRLRSLLQHIRSRPDQQGERSQLLMQGILQLALRHAWSAVCCH